MAGTAAAAPAQDAERTQQEPEEIIDADVVPDHEHDDSGASVGMHGTALERITTASAIIRAEEPDQILTKASKIAASLKDLIDQQGLAVDVGGRKKHVEVNGWQALGTLLGALGGEALHAETVWTRRVLDPDGQPVRHSYTAHVKRYYSKAQGGGLKSETTYDVDGFDWEACVEIRTAGGVLVGRAEAMCSRAEEQWGKSADFAVRSMAETRAESRAYRRAAGWLVAIAGYNPTPAEEMAGVRRDDDEPAASGPPFGAACDNAQLIKFRKALAYLMGLPSEGDARITGVCRAVAQAAGGYLPNVCAVAVCLVAKMIAEERKKATEAQSQPEPEPTEEPPPPSTGEQQTLDDRPPAGTIEPPSELTEEALRTAGCSCAAPPELHPDSPQVDDDCPLKGHGIPF